MQQVMDFFRPGAVVLQMGADSLAGDKLGGFNLTLQGNESMMFPATFLDTVRSRRMCEFY